MTRLLRHRQTLLFTAFLLLAGCHQQASPPAPRVPAQSGKGADTSAPDARLVTAQAFRIQDGDSFIARLQDGSRLTVRLSGIDAPERSQPHADESRQNLQRLLQGRSLQIHIAKKDQYGRAVAQVFAQSDAADIDVGLAQMERGLAWFYHHYRTDLPPEWREVYAKAEQAARRARLGLWQAPVAQPPWEFRASRRVEPASAGR
jgi:micrococcal nuclease